MISRKLAWTIGVASALWGANTLAYDCIDLPEWKRQHYYLYGDEV